MSTRKVSRRKFIATAGAGGLGLALAACTPSPTPSATVAAPPTVPATSGPISVATPIIGAAKRGGTLIDARIYEAESLDPHVSQTQAAQAMSPMFYEPLIGYDPQLRLVPKLAESWEMKDTQTYQIKLRKGVRFHSGRELTADDVKYSFDRMLNPDVGAAQKSQLDNVDSVSIASSDTIEFKLKVPDVVFPWDLGRAFIVPQEVQDQPMDYLKTHVNGTGPFMLQEWKPDVETTQIANPQYWDPGLPLLDSIKIRIFAEEASVIAALRTGDVDHTTLTDPNNFELLKQNPQLNLLLTPFNGPLYLIFNLRQTPMDDVKIRQALSQGMDRSEILRVVGAGLGSVCGALPPTFSDVYVPPDQLPFYDFDVDKAKALLKASSMPNGFSMDCLYITTLPIMKTSAELLKSMWEKLGIQVELKGLETGGWLDLAVNNKGPWSFSTNLDYKGITPEGCLSFIVMCGSIGDKWWGICYPELDKMLKEARGTTDPAKRKELWKQIQIFMATQNPLLNTFARTNVDVTQKWLQGFRAWPDQTNPTWQYVWLDKS